MAGEGLEFGNYVVEGELGRGGMGIVYQARHKFLERTAAIKLVYPFFLHDSETRARFLREAQVGSSVEHPNLVRIYDFGEQAGQAYIAMELLDGQPLSAMLPDQPMPIAAAVPVLRQVAAGLDALHARGLVHRDVKPENVLVCRDGRAVLLDYGIAQPLDDPSGFTQAGTVVGTPTYLAPERWRGGAASPASDGYAFGVLAYRMLTGRLPFSGTGPLDVMRAAVEGEPPDPRLFAPAMSAAAAHAILAQLSKSASGRQRSLRAVVEVLANAAESAPAPSPLDPAFAPTVEHQGVFQPPAAAPPPGTPPQRQMVLQPPLSSRPPRRKKGRVTRRLALGVLGIGAMVGGVAVVGAGSYLLLARQLNLGVPAGGAFDPRSFGVEFSAPQGLAVDSQGNIYVADSGADRIQKLSPKGAPLATWGASGSAPGELVGPAGLALDVAGNLYVVDLGNHRIQKLSPSGEPLAQFGGIGSGPGQFRSPVSVAVDTQGNLFVADSGNHRIQKLAPSGTVLAVWGQRGTAPGQFAFPHGVAVDAQGNVLVSEVGNDRIQKLSADGSPLERWGSFGASAGQFNSPSGIAVGKDGSIFVVDSENHRIQKLSASGTPVAQWGAPGSDPGQFADPTFVALDPQGNLYVADSGNNRVQSLSADGNPIR